MVIKIVTDSTADLSEDVIEQFDITVVPLNVIFGDQVLRDGIDISADAFYDRLQRDSVHPTTSQPSPEAFKDVYDKLIASGADHIVSIHISAKLSGTHHSAYLASQQRDNADGVWIFDSETVSLPLGMIVIRAAEASRSGSIDEVHRAVNDAIAHNNLLFMADTLEYVRRGGRIGRARALLGSMLQIKPLLAMEDGEVTVAARPRTRARALQEMVELTVSRPNLGQIGIAHTTVPEYAETLRSEVIKRLPDIPITMGRLGPVLGAHVGPGSLGICYMERSSDHFESRG